MTLKSQEEQLLRQVIRGERSWVDLQDIGICVTMDEGKCEVDNPRQLSLAVTLEDLAHGVLALQSVPERLRGWAWFVLASSSIYELDSEEDVRSELFLEALWDLAFGDQMNRRVIEIAADLIQG